MKIAICVSGEPREYEHTYYSLVTWAERNNADIFLHCWDNTTRPGLNNYKNDTPTETIYKNSNNLREDLIKKYNPKKCKVENKNELIDYINTHRVIHIPADYEKYTNSNYGSVSQWFSAQRANLLKRQYEKDNDIVYDIQIKTRFDTFFNIASSMDPEVVNISYYDNCIYTPWIHIQNGMFMMEYSTLIGKNDLQDKLWSNIIQDISQTCVFGKCNPHESIMYHVKNKNILLKTWHKMSILFKILRSSSKNNILLDLFNHQNFSQIEQYINSVYKEYKRL